MTNEEKRECVKKILEWALNRVIDGESPNPLDGDYIVNLLEIDVPLNSFDEISEEEMKKMTEELLESDLGLQKKRERAVAVVEATAL